MSFHPTADREQRRIFARPRKAEYGCHYCVLHTLHALYVTPVTRAADRTTVTAAPVAFVVG